MCKRADIGACFGIEIPDCNTLYLSFPQFASCHTINPRHFEAVLLSLGVWSFGLLAIIITLLVYVPNAWPAKVPCAEHLQKYSFV